MPALSPHAAPRTATDVLALLRAGPTRTVTVGPVDVATWTVGHGPDLVLIHGWPLHSATWRRHVPVLAEHFTCHLIDMPGAGATRCQPGAGGGLPDYARITRAVLDALGLRRYALLAHDSGGAVARLLAARDRERVTALVIAGTEIPGWRPWQLRSFLALAKIPGGAAALTSTLRVGFIRRSRFGFAGCFRDPRYADGEFFELFVDPLLHSRETVAGQLGLLRHFDWRVIDDLAAAHAATTAPACLIWGSDDAFFPAERARAMTRQFGGEAEFHVIDGGRLFVHEDHPEQFLAIALPFLRRHIGM
jgi:haloalkane dehalogenase